MTHAEFVRGYRAGAIRVNIDRKSAARYVSARLWLPLVAMPVLGIGVALALVGWLWTGFTLIALGTLVPFLIKRSAPDFVLVQALEDRAFYDDVIARESLELTRPAT